MSLSHSTTTPFGRRPASLGQIAAGMELQRNLDAAAASGSNAPEAVNKWKLFRTLTEIRERLGVSDRALSVLNALLSFHPETALTLPRRNEDAKEGEAGCCDLVVFPSNKALGLRAHGMAEKTLRRHLAALVESGLIIRRDSPNGKRYARKDATGEERFSHVYGFDLTPLVGRAPEFETLAEDLRRAARARAVLKERISLHRRDVAKLIALGLDEGADGPWEDFRQQFMRLVMPLRRIHDDAGLETVSEEISALRGAVSEALECHVWLQTMTGNDGNFDRHQSNSNTQRYKDFEPASKEEGADSPRNAPEQKSATSDGTSPCPLGMVLEACPDVRDYGASGTVKNWWQFIDAVRAIRPMLGISPDAWKAAVEAMGETDAAIAVAVILQRSEYSSEALTATGLDGKKLTAVNFSPAITSPGGYLRALTEKALAGEFLPGPVLMALIGQRLKVKRAGGWTGKS
jgi:replication initiation protein RepC